jgi:hypothetical protein
MIKNNEYKALVDKLAEEIIEGVAMEKEAAGAPDKVKGAPQIIIESLKNKRALAAEKAKDQARRAKDTSKYGKGRGMLGSSNSVQGNAATGGFGKSVSKSASNVDLFIEKVAADNNMSFEDTADVLERVATAYQEAISKFEDSQLRKEAAGEVYEEAEADEVESAAQLEAAVQVLEELGVPVEDLLGDEDEEGDEEEGEEE